MVEAAAMAFVAVAAAVVVMSKGVVCVPDVLLLGRLNSGAQHIDTLCALLLITARAPAAAIPFHLPRPPPLHYSCIQTNLRFIPCTRRAHHNTL